MTLEISILLLRIGIVVLLFLFLAQALLLIRRDLRRAGVHRLEQGGRLRIVESGAANLRKGDFLPLLVFNSLGRNDGNSLPILDDFVSGEHILLSHDGGIWKLEDLGSTNGTYVNGQRVEETAILTYGDTFQLGRTKLRLERPQLD
ncbi:MAG: FHA domain-containing protein [Dehalococcoidia bacterium]|nr:FHA domain-containing protein [Dehalococcoidia bacterium]